MKQRRPGFTIVELLVVVSIIALLIAILLPAIGKARDAARMTQSQGNLRNLSVACDTYAADWGDRQWTAVPDDAGLVNGDGIEYGEKVGCMGQMFVGYDAEGDLWAWWVAGPLCGSNSGYPGPAGYWEYCFDNVFSPHGSREDRRTFGAFRLCTAKAFNSYVVDWPRVQYQVDLADMTGAVLRVPEQTDAAFGAALLAAHAHGAFETLSSAATAGFRTQAEFCPDKRSHACYAKISRDYKTAFAKFYE